MTDRPDELASLFTARVTDENGRYTVSIPKRLFERGPITNGDALRVALIDGDEARGSASIHSADAPSDASPTDTRSADNHAATVAGRRTPSGASDAPGLTTETTASPSGETTRTARPPAEATATTRVDPRHREG
jgi:hypothetical protein